MTRLKKPANEITLWDIYKAAVTALKNSLSATTIEELYVAIRTHINQKIDFSSIVAWYKENGFENQAGTEGI